MNIPQEILYELGAAMEQWTDARVISTLHLENLLMFYIYTPEVLSQFGIQLLGHSWRQKNGQTLLTVKVKEKDTPLVGFITSDTPIGCMVRFLDLLEDDRLNWVRDRYPWI